MKKLLLTLIMVLFSLPMFADEITIKPKDPPKTGTGQTRNKTELIVPSASIEDGVVTIKTELASWGVTVTVYNGDGAVVYTSVSATESKTHEFTVGELAEGDYVLEVQLGEELYEGYFSI